MNSSKEAKFFEQLDLREISQILEIGYSAAAKALSRGRSKLGRVFGSPNVEM